MLNISIKKQDKVMKILANYPKNEAGYIYQPTDLKKPLRFLSDYELLIVFAILQDNGLIEYNQSNNPDFSYIDSIAITPKGYSYTPEKEYINQQKWFDRLWGFLIGIATGSILTYIIPLTINLAIGK